MGVVIAFGSGTQPERIRKVALGAGLDCADQDCVALDQLEARVAQTAPDLVLVEVGEEREKALEAVGVVSTQFTAPILAVGPKGDHELALCLVRSGAQQYLQSEALREELDRELERLSKRGGDPRTRGAVISVFSPTAGCGTSVIAANLAGALGRKYPEHVALTELGRDEGDLALMLDITPKYTIDDASRRWERLDTLSLASSLVKHKSGLSVLAHQVDRADAEALCPESVRRISVLLRTMFDFTVVDLKGRLDDPVQLEAIHLSDALLVVVRPDVPAVRRASRIIDRLLDHGVEKSKLRLLINRWGQSGQLPLATIRDSLDIDPFLLIPDDSKRVNHAVNHGQLLHEIGRGSAIVRRFDELAKRLNGRS